MVFQGQVPGLAKRAQQHWASSSSSDISRLGTAPLSRRKSRRVIPGGAAVPESLAARVVEECARIICTLDMPDESDKENKSTASHQRPASDGGGVQTGMQQGPERRRASLGQVMTQMDVRRNSLHLYEVSLTSGLLQCERMLLQPNATISVDGSIVMADFQLQDYLCTSTEETLSAEPDIKAIQVMCDVKRSGCNQENSAATAPVQAASAGFMETQYAKTGNVVEEDLLLSPFFPIFEYDDNELMNMVEMLFESFGLLTKFHIDHLTFSIFMREVRSRYQRNHYHNFRHAFDVCQTVSSLVHKCRNDFGFSDLTILGLLISALCHDIKHPGLTNIFLVAVKSPVAILYKGKSVLENFHFSSTMALLAERRCNILGKLTAKEFEFCEATIRMCIMSTDIALHADYLQMFNEALTNKVSSEYKQNVVAAMLLKFSDVSNVWKQWSASYRWSFLLVKEWEVQSKIENRHLGATAMGPHKTVDPQSLPQHIGQSTTSFIDFFVRPMLSLVVKHIPTLEHIFEGINANSEAYKYLAGHREK